MFINFTLVNITLLVFTQSHAMLCYPCVWRRKVAQITGEWFDDSLIKKLHKKVCTIKIAEYYEKLAMLGQLFHVHVRI